MRMYLVDVRFELGALGVVANRVAEILFAKLELLVTKLFHFHENVFVDECATIVMHFHLILKLTAHCKPSVTQRAVTASVRAY